MTIPAKVEAIRVGDGEADMRLDRWFRVHFPEVGYTYLQKLLRSGQIRVDSKRAQANDRLTAGSEIRVPSVVRQPKKAGPGLQAPPGVSKGDRDAIEKMIIYEDETVLVLNKPFGLAVQGGTGSSPYRAVAPAPTNVVQSPQASVRTSRTVVDAPAVGRWTRKTACWVPGAMLTVLPGLMRP